ncbi:MAG: sigma-70 family RNA polymerase sigma factor [Candidatus Dormibacteraeota bacterium]|nr:sigma-70 family RNA polymerase sigma factor [Candidatus Dormibacteraeota bacterium]
MASSPVTGSGEFVRQTEPFRRELLAHCYRMLGSADDAEDLVQETYLRAWRSFERFEGRSSIRSWLYRIATNACLTALKQRRPRVLSSGLGAPSDDPDGPPLPAGPEVVWLEPLPDRLVGAGSEDPAEIVAQRQQLRLALVASLQYLPARQRAVLLLREVLAFPAAEVARILDTTTAGVKSALQRARARLDEVVPAVEQVSEPTDPDARRLLERYIAAFESSDAVALERTLREDAVLEMTGTRTWFSGLRTCMPYFRSQALGSPGEWRMVATAANGQPAAAVYRRDAEGVHRAFGVAVLTTTPTGIARITLFGDPALVARCGLPPVAPALPGQP